MKEWKRKVAAFVLLTLAASARAGKLDLDIYASGPLVPHSRAEVAGPLVYTWVPGDPRDAQDAPAWVRHLSHVGYAGLGAAGMAAGIASGGVAPAIGFGLVAIVQSFLEWEEIKSPSPERSE